MSEEIVIEPADPKTIVDNARIRDRRKVVTPVFIALIIALIMSGISNIALGIVMSDTNRVVKYIDDQTDPSRQIKQQKALNKILVTIDCNVRFAVQEAFDELEQQGILAPDSVTITDNCSPQTTTTEK